MKNRFLAAVAVAGLMTLGACNAAATKEETDAGNAFENQADNMEAAADNAVMGSNTEAMLENKADELEEKADNAGKGDLTSGSMGNGTETKK